MALVQDYLSPTFSAERSKLCFVTFTMLIVVVGDGIFFFSSGILFGDGFVMFV